MRKVFSVLLGLILMLLPVWSLALEFDDNLSGEVYYPYGSDAETATYVYRYSYPKIAGDSDVATMINSTYAYEASYIETFTVPVNGDMYGEGETQYYTDMQSEVTCVSDDYLSILFKTEEFTGGAVYTKISAHVFSLTGSKAGSVTSLPYILGSLKADETDEWLLERQTKKCDACIREMIWSILQEQEAKGQIDMYDDVDYEFFEGCFYPEEDFYMNEDGSLTFFLQEDSVVPSVQGILTFSFTLDEILDEL